MSDHYANPVGARQQGVPDALQQPIARRKLSHEVLDRLLGRVRAGEFPPGSFLPSERELMVTLGVGRPAVREALQSMQRMGLVQIIHGEGAKVLSLSAESMIAQVSDTALHLLAGSSDLLEHLKEARLHFEVAMARLAAQRAAPHQIEQLRQKLEEHRASLGDPELFQRTDMAFHNAIAEISGNRIYAAVSRAMLQWLEQFHRELVRAPGAERSTLAEHVKLFKRIASHDAEGAAEAITAHLKRANQHYRNPSQPQSQRPATTARRSKSA